MEFCSLSSCSYANSFVVKDNNTCILIDLGLRKRDIKPFLGSVGLSVGDIDAVLVTHCHIDHVYGLKFFLKERDVQVYSTAGVLKQLTDSYSFNRTPRLGIIYEGVEENIGSLAITPVRLSHDVETIGFAISSGGRRLGFLTDTGYVPESCLKDFKSMDYLYIESNHDVEMYKNSSKPPHVKRRNLGPNGHLSNEQCGLALKSMGLKNCKLVMLGHLSEDDNDPKKALDCARRNLAPEVTLVSVPARVPGVWSDVLIK